ncbi:MAG TPA: E3 binding domain-containing protein, partial [Anaerolineae bacterium]
GVSVSHPPEEAALNPAVTKPSADTRLFISPRAKRLADATSVPWQTIIGTGPQGAIVERDVKRAMQNAGNPTSLINPALDISNSSATTEHFWNYHFCDGEVDLSKAVALCSRLELHGLKISISDFVLFVCARALREIDAYSTKPLVRLWVNNNELVWQEIRREWTRSLALLTQHPRTTDQPEPHAEINLVFAEIGVFGFDSTDSLTAANVSKLLTIGRNKTRQDGSAFAHLSLRYRADGMPAGAARRFMQSVIIWIEDPDLLF